MFMPRMLAVDTLRAVGTVLATSAADVLEPLRLPCSSTSVHIPQVPGAAWLRHGASGVVLCECVHAYVLVCSTGKGMLSHCGLRTERKLL